MSGDDVFAFLLGHHVATRMTSAEDADAREAIRRRAALNAIHAQGELRRENEWLRTLVRALAELCLQKGLITEQELKDRIAKIDAEDAERAKARRDAVRTRRKRPR